MLLRVVILFAVVTSLFAANIRMYLKEGGFQMVTEYEVESDRVRYFSSERGQWEEIPLELVDLERTNKEAASREAELTERLAAEAAEDAAIRAQKERLARVPQNPGVYLAQGDDFRRLEQAEVALSSSKTRSILKILTPIPIVPGKTTAEIEGGASALRLDDPLPEFYFRLAQEERLAIVRLAPKKNIRVVQEVNILPETREMLYEEDTVPTFKRQIDRRLYTVSPQKPLEPGEYAVIEYTEGELNLQVWDFGVGPAKK